MIGHGPCDNFRHPGRDDGNKSFVNGNQINRSATGPRSFPGRQGLVVGDLLFAPLKRLELGAVETLEVGGIFARGVVGAAVNPVILAEDLGAEVRDGLVGVPPKKWRGKAQQLEYGLRLIGLQGELSEGLRG